MLSHKRKMTLLEAPTGTLLFYYKDITQEIVHTLLLEEYGVSKKWVIIMDRRQDLNVTSTPAGKRGPSAWDHYCARGFVDLRHGTITVPEVLEEARRNGVQTKKIEIILVFVKIMLHVLTCVVSNNVFGIEMVLCDSMICISRGSI